MSFWQRWAHQLLHVNNQPFMVTAGSLFVVLLQVAEAHEPISLLHVGVAAMYLKYSICEQALCLRSPGYHFYHCNSYTCCWITISATALAATATSIVTVIFFHARPPFISHNCQCSYLCHHPRKVAAAAITALAAAIGKTNAGGGSAIATMAAAAIATADTFAIHNRHYAIVSQLCVWRCGAASGSGCSRLCVGPSSAQLQFASRGLGDVPCPAWLPECAARICCAG